MTPTSPTTDKPPPPRRWIPLSLRMFVSLLMILMAVCTWQGVCAYRRGIALREVKHFNGSVQWLHQRTPEWLLQWLGDDRMEWLSDPDHVVFWPDDENLLRRSRHGGTMDWGAGPRIDDAALRCVLGLPDLKSLDVAFSSVGDAGVKHVSRLQKLESLRLQGTDVSDLSIPILSQMRSLKTLNVLDTRISIPGGLALEAALPECKVQGPHNDPEDLTLWFEAAKRKKN